MKPLLLAAVLLACAPFAQSQGCAQCRDNTAATPPATQRAYRHTIALLAVTGGGLFGGTLLLFKKN